jgi:hypothetical protein
MNLTDIGSNICKKTDPSCDFLQSFHTNELVVQKCMLKCKLQPRTRHEVPNGKQKYGCTLSFTLPQYGSGWSRPYPSRSIFGKDMRKLGGLHDQPGRLWKISPHRDSIPKQSSPKRVAMHTTLSQPTVQMGTRPFPPILFSAHFAYYLWVLRLVL